MHSNRAKLDYPSSDASTVLYLDVYHHLPHIWLHLIMHTPFSLAKNPKGLGTPGELRVERTGAKRFVDHPSRTFCIRAWQRVPLISDIMVHNLGH